METQKIFGIGLSRTGTTSLTGALSCLGYKSKHYPSYYIDAFMRANIRESELNNFEVLTDAPVAYLYKELDAKFPNSKFILTLREDDLWLESAKKFFTRPEGRNSNGDVSDFLKCLKPKNKVWRNGYIMRHLVYGSFKFNKKKYLKSYQNHNQSVMDYFKDREHDLLVIDLTQDEYQWEMLCPFLGKEIPEIPFPHHNNSKN